MPKRIQEQSPDGNIPRRVFARTIRMCKTCRCCRRFIVSIYEEDPWEWACGGCGYVLGSGILQRMSTFKERLKERELVKARWKDAVKIEDVLREMENR